MVDSRTVAIRSLLTEQYVRVNDRHGVEHAGWARLGAWLFGCLADQAEVRWVMMHQAQQAAPGNRRPRGQIDGDVKIQTRLLQASRQVGGGA
jgi:hypothetical protein